MRAILPDRIGRAPEVTGAVQQPPWETFLPRMSSPVLHVAPCALPDGLSLDLLDERRFGNGVEHLHYRTRT